MLLRNFTQFYLLKQPLFDNTFRSLAKMKPLFSSPITVSHPKTDSSCILQRLFENVHILMSLIIGQLMTNFSRASTLRADIMAVSNDGDLWMTKFVRGYSRVCACLLFNHFKQDFICPLQKISLTFDLSSSLMAWFFLPFFLTGIVKPSVLPIFPTYESCKINTKQFSNDWTIISIK